MTIITNQPPINKKDFAITERQLSNNEGNPLGPSETNTFLYALQKKHNSIGFVPTTYSSSPKKETYITTVEEFKNDHSKTKLFIPIVIEGYRSLHANDDRSGFIAHALYYMKMLGHFLRGGCIEDHIVMLSAHRIKETVNAFYCEYYDPKGRNVNELQFVKGSNQELNVRDMIKNVQLTLDKHYECCSAKRNDGFWYWNYNTYLYNHNNGRISADQSIFNTVDCGYLVMRRCAQLAEQEGFESTDIGTIGSKALSLVKQHVNIDELISSVANHDPMLSEPSNSSSDIEDFATI